MKFACNGVVCYVVGMDHVQKNIDRGHTRFAQYVIPLLAQHGWPSSWQCMQGTIPDTKHGIDYMVGTTPVAARIWDGKPNNILHCVGTIHGTRHTYGVNQNVGVVGQQSNHAKIHH